MEDRNAYLYHGANFGLQPAAQNVLSATAGYQHMNVGILPATESESEKDAISFQHVNIQLRDSDSKEIQPPFIS